MLTSSRSRPRSASLRFAHHFVDLDYVILTHHLVLRLKVSIMNVTMWLTAWTPFAIICMIGTWGDVSKITPLVSAIPVILAKTSCAYNPMIYAISHPKYREVGY